VRAHVISQLALCCGARKETGLPPLAGRALAPDIYVIRSPIMLPASRRELARPAPTSAAAAGRDEEGKLEPLAKTSKCNFNHATLGCYP